MKKLFFIVSLLLSMSLINFSFYFAQVQNSNTLFMPYVTEDTLRYELFILNGDNFSETKHIIKQAAESNKINVSISITSMNHENKTYNIYWLINNEKYINNLKGIDPKLSFNSFNELSSMINNFDPNQSHKINYFSDLMDISFGHFDFFEGPTFNTSITIFSSDDSNLQSFMNNLRQNGVIFEVNEYYDTGIPSKLDLFIPYLLYKNPLLILYIMLYFIIIFYLMHKDSRNSTIFFINGISKFSYSNRYFISTLSLILIPQTIAFFYLLFMTGFDLDLFIPAASQNVIQMMYLLISTYIFTLMTVYSFTNITIDSYIRNHKNRRSNLILGIFKLIIISLTITVIVPLIGSISKINRLNTSLKSAVKNYNGIYQLDDHGYSGSVIADREESIINLIADNDKVLYVKNIYSPSYENDDDFFYFNSILYANYNYILNQRLETSDLNTIDNISADTIYVSPSQYNIAKEKVKTTRHLCINFDDCNMPQVTEVSEGSFISILTNDPYIDATKYSQNFIIIPITTIDNLTYTFFKLDNDNDIETMKITLSQLLAEDNIEFIELSSQFKKEISINNFILFQKTIYCISYLVLNFIISMLYYMVIVDTHKKEMAIYWVNGVSKFNYLYSEVFKQIIITGISIIVVKFIFGIYASSVILLLVFGLLSIFDLFSVLYYKKILTKNLKQYVKERD